MQAPVLWQIPTPDFTPEQLAALEDKLEQRILEIAGLAGRKVLTTSLAAEDMVISDAICRAGAKIDFVVLDTGMLNEETVALIATSESAFQRHFHVFRPLTAKVHAFIEENGRLPMYESLEKRHACCELRKVEPLNRALKGAQVWLTGQRRSQSVTRAHLAFHEYDDARHLEKFNPIFDFSEEDVWALVHAHHLPINPLYRRGYPSIGCAPCSKPVRAGEDVRAGRWWWENAANKECGLHTH